MTSTKPLQSEPFKKKNLHVHMPGNAFFREAGHFDFTKDRLDCSSNGRKANISIKICFTSRFEMLSLKPTNLVVAKYIFWPPCWCTNCTPTWRSPMGLSY